MCNKMDFIKKYLKWLSTFLVLTGIFQKSYLAAMLATFGVVLGAAYMLWLTKRVIFGDTKNNEIKNRWQ